MAYNQQLPTLLLSILFYALDWTFVETIAPQANKQTNPPQSTQPHSKFYIPRLNMISNVLYKLKEVPNLIHIAMMTLYIYIYNYICVWYLINWRLLLLWWCMFIIKILIWSKIIFVDGQYFVTSPIIHSFVINIFSLYKCHIEIVDSYIFSLVCENMYMRPTPCNEVRPKIIRIKSELVCTWPIGLEHLHTSPNCPYNWVELPFTPKKSPPLIYKRRCNWTKGSSPCSCPAS